MMSHLPAGKVHDNFTAWAGHNGITIKKLKVAAIPNAGIGIVATENIKVHMNRVLIGHIMIQMHHFPIVKSSSSNCTYHDYHSTLLLLHTYFTFVNPLSDMFIPTLMHPMPRQERLSYSRPHMLSLPERLRWHQRLHCPKELIKMG